MASASNTIRRVGITLLALMLVTSMVAPSAMAASSAPDGDGFAGDECGRSITELTFDVMTGHLYKSLECEAQQEENVSRADLAAGGSSAERVQITHETLTDNHLQDTKTFARTIAKEEIYTSMVNGANVSNAKANVTEALEDYYTGIQINTIETYNTQAVQVYYWSNASIQEGIGEAVAWGNRDRADPSTEWHDYSPQYHAQSPTTVDSGDYQTRLINGSTREVYLLTFEDDNPTDWHYRPFMNVSSLANETRDGAFNNPAMPEVYIAGTDTPTGDSPQNWASHSSVSFALNGSSYYFLNESITDQYEQVNTNAMTLTENVYGNYTAEELQNSTFLDPLTITAQWNTNANSTGYYGWSAAEAGALGIGTNANSSFTINYTSDGDGTAYEAGDQQNATSINMSGTLFTNWDPNPNETYAFERGVTYNTSDADNPVYFVHQLNNSSATVWLDGEFTIDDLTNTRTGDSLNSTGLDDKNRQTLNTTQYIIEMEEFAEYRNKSSESYDAGGGGGGGGFNFDFGAAGIGFIAILLGGAYLVTSGASKAS